MYQSRKVDTKKYFFLFHFFKSGHTPHFGPFGFFKIGIAALPAEETSVLAKVFLKFMRSR